MSGEWKPGTVLGDGTGRVFYAIEVTENSLAAAQTRQAWEEGSSIVESDGNGWHASRFGNLRPLVVIDPEDREAVERLLVTYGRQFTDWTPETDTNVTRLQAALREYANPKPPRPDEPQGLGAVVEDEDGNPWVKTLPGRDEDAYEWIAGFPSNPKLVSYADIAAVRVLSPGVEAS